MRVLTFLTVLMLLGVFSYAGLKPGESKESLEKRKKWSAMVQRIRKQGLANPKAEEDLRRALGMAEKIKHPSAVIYSLDLLVEHYSVREKYGNAEQVSRKQLKLVNLAEPNSFKVSRLTGRLALYLEKQGKFKEASQLYQKAWNGLALSSVDYQKKKYKGMTRGFMPAYEYTTRNYAAFLRMRKKVVQAKKIETQLISTVAAFRKYEATLLRKRAAKKKHKL